jgi:hypothetical protein
MMLVLMPAIVATLQSFQTLSSIVCAGVRLLDGFCDGFRQLTVQVGKIFDRVNAGRHGGHKAKEEVVRPHLVLANSFYCFPALEI